MVLVSAYQPAGWTETLDDFESFLLVLAISILVENPCGGLGNHFVGRENAAHFRFDMKLKKLYGTLSHEIVFRNFLRLKSLCSRK